MNISEIWADAAHGIGEAGHAHTGHQPDRGDKRKEQPSGGYTENPDVLDVRA